MKSADSLRFNLLNKKKFLKASFFWQIHSIHSNQLSSNLVRTLCHAYYTAHWRKREARRVRECEAILSPQVP